MPPIPPARQRVVEVIADLGDGHSPRRRYGSGLLIGGRQLLTSAHVVVDAIEVTIRRPDKSSLRAVLENALIGDPDARRLDMALLDVPEAADLPPVPLALVDRNVPTGARIEGCAAVGYPQWTEIRRDADGLAIRETAQVVGHIAPLSGLVEDLLSLEVTATPRPLPGGGTALAESEWSGMSGAAVFAPDPSANGGEVLIGVVAEHSPRRGQQNITVLPLDRLTDRATGPPNAEEWWRRLGVADPMHLPKISDRSAARVPVPSEAVPANYVDRPEITGPLIAYLLGSEPIPKGRAIITAVHGLGGIGKTTVARWLVWQPEIEQRFREGRIWVTLGNEPPDAITKITDCVSQLDPTVKTKSTEEAARADLAALLQDRSILFIIDDVWPGKSAEVAKALIVPSPYSRFLLTTRFPGLADDPEIQARDFPLDEMNAVQAAELITQALGHELSAAEQALAQRLCEMTGGHPLALELAAARIRKGRKWEILLDDLAAEIGRLDAFEETEAIRIAEPSESETRKKTRSVRASLLLSVRYLYRAGQNWLERFAWLGILAEDAIITPRMAATLWSTGEETAAVYLRELSGAGLLRATDDSYRIHDLMHDLALELLFAPTTPVRPGDIPGFGLTLRDANRQFLERYRSKTGRGLWHTLQEDGYIHDHLVRHFEQAGWESEIESLLWEESADGDCGWYSARERLGQTAGFLADVGRVWSYADRMGAAATSEVQIIRKASPAAQALVLQIRCALCRATVVALSTNAPADLLAEALRAGILTPSQCMEILGNIVDHEKRAQALIELSPLLPEPQLRQAFGMAQKIRGISVTDDVVKARTLAEIARYLPEQEKTRAMSQALEALRLPQGDPRIAEERVRLLADLAKRLPKSAKDATLAEALVAARGVSDELPRVRALTDVAEHLGAEQRHPILTDALEAARAISEPSTRAAALLAVAEHLANSEKTSTVSEALRAARDILDLFDRAATLARVSEHFPEPNRSEVETEALEALRATEDKTRRALYLARFLAPHMTGSQKRAALAEARDLSSKVQEPIWQTQILTEIGVHSTGAARHEALNEALHSARAAEGPTARAWLLGTLAIHLQGPVKSQVLREALKASRAIADHKEVSAAFTQLASHLARQSAATLIDAALTELVSAVKEYQQVKVTRGRWAPAVFVDEVSTHEILRDLLPHLTYTQKTQTLGLVALISNEPERAKTLLTLAPHLEESQKAQLLAVACSITNQSERARALIGLGKCAPEALQRALLDAVQEIEPLGDRAEALKQIAVHLIESLKGIALGEALDAGRLIGDEAARARVLTSLVTHLAEPLRAAAVENALDAADRINDQSVWAWSLIGLVPHLAEPTKSKIIKKALEAAKFITEDWRERANAVVALGPHLTGDLGARALAVVRQMENEGTRAAALGGLAPHLNVETRGAALDIACHLDEWLRAQVLADFASNSSGSFVSNELLAAARNIRDEPARVVALTGLAQHLPEPHPTGALEEAVNVAWRVRDENARANALISIVSHLPEKLKDVVLHEAFTTARNIRDNWTRQRTLMDLAPRLQDTDRSVALREALEAARRDADKDSLKALAPHLPEPERSEILHDLLTEARNFRDPVLQAHEVVELSELLMICVTSRPSPISSHWSEVLRILSSHSRPNFLNYFTRVLPLALALAGEADAEQVILGTFNAIQDVCRWWP